MTDCLIARQRIAVVREPFDFDFWRDFPKTRIEPGRAAKHAAATAQQAGVCVLPLVDQGSGQIAAADVFRERQRDIVRNLGFEFYLGSLPPCGNLLNKPLSSVNRVSFARGV